jgi:glycosyltransferase involved in cell wall biosynthesis
MSVLFDVSGLTAGQAAARLSARGVVADEVVQRDAFNPRRAFATLRRMRRVRPQACYIFCRHAATQFNRFPLKLMAALSGARTIRFCDEREFGPGIAPAHVIFKDGPLYLWRCFYALLAVLGFAAAYVLLSLIVRLRKPPAPPSLPVRRLCYIKTDFWHDLKAGGSVTHTREFINAGCELGYEVKVFSCDPLVHYRLKPQVEVVEPSPGLYDLPIIFSQMEYNLRFPLALWRKLRGCALDGIYQRHSTNNFSGVALSALLKVPFFLEHNSSSVWIAKNWSAERTSIIPGLCERLNFSGAYRIAVVSEALKQGLLSAGLDDAKVSVNPNGVDPVRFGPHVDASAIRKTLPGGKLLVGFIGVFGQWHGVLTLMRCVKHVIKDCENAHFVIIGDGTLKQQMLDILRQDGTAEHVTFVGLVPHDLAPAHLNACDVLVSPHEDMADGSTFFGSPTKIFEYMATGKGIVASRVGQLGALLEDEQDALLAQQKNETELAEKIARLLRDPALRGRLGASARRKVATTYTWQENFRRAISPIESSELAETNVCLCRSAKA